MEFEMATSQTNGGSRQHESLAPGPFVLTRDDFQRISAILHEDAGIHLTDAKAMLVYSRLAKRLRALGLESFRDYCALISSERGVDERQKMIAAMTTNVTRFFREPHHFDDLKNKILVKRASDIRNGARLRIWSAACSDGQEPYSIAMTILSVIPEAAQLDVRVLATDIDPNMISTGRAGVYGGDAMQALPRDLQKRWFSPAEEGDSWRVTPHLASLVAFRELNLLKSWPFKGRFDAVFCRNVVIYFEQRTQHELWRRFRGTLLPHGRLYIGHSERVSGPAAQDYESDGLTTYRLRGESS